VCAGEAQIPYAVSKSHETRHHRQALVPDPKALPLAEIRDTLLGDAVLANPAWLGNLGRGHAAVKVSLPRTMALKIAEYLEATADCDESCHWDPKINRVTPRELRLEIERVRKWAVQIRAAAEPKQFTSGEKHG
jgi:hypothetical protein